MTFALQRQPNGRYRLLADGVVVFDNEREAIARFIYRELLDPAHQDDPAVEAAARAAVIEKERAA